MASPRQNSRLRTIIDQAPHGIALFAAAAFGVGLALFAYAGTFSRFWADDYCYSATIKQLGLFAGILDWYQTSGNRVSTLVPVALADLFGGQAVRWVPLAVMALWLGALIFFLRQVLPAQRWRWTVLLALVTVYFVVLLAPDRLQTVYWRMGTLHYSLPMPLLLLLVGLLIKEAARPGPRWGVGVLLGLLAFFNSGLSETSAALQSGLLLAAVALALIASIRPRWLGRLGCTCLGWLGSLRGALFLALPLAGSLLMMLMMTQAPANEWRQAVMPPPDNLLMIIPVAMRYAAEFFYFAVRSKPVSFGLYGLVVLVTGLMAWPAVPAISPTNGPAGALVRSAPIRYALGYALGYYALSGLIALLFAYLLTAASFAPSAFANLAYPAGRALMPAHFALLAGIGAAALCAARMLTALVPARRAGWLRGLAAVLLLAAALYPWRMLPVVRQDTADLSIRAGRSDARASEVQRQINEKQFDVRVEMIDVVQTLEDLGPDPDFWINRCAAVYYGVRTITALP